MAEALIFKVLHVCVKAQETSIKHISLTTPQKQHDFTGPLFSSVTVN